MQMTDLEAMAKRLEAEEPSEKFADTIRKDLCRALFPDKRPGAKVHLVQAVIARDDLNAAFDLFREVMPGWSARLFDGSGEVHKTFQSAWLYEKTNGGGLVPGAGHAYGQNDDHLAMALLAAICRAVAK